MEKYYQVTYLLKVLDQITFFDHPTGGLLSIYWYTHVPAFWGIFS